MRYLWIGLLLLGFGAVSCGLGDTQIEDEAAIRQRAQEYVAAYNRGDARAATAVYTADATHTYALGFTHEGRGAIESGLAELLAGPMQGSTITLTTESVRFLKPDIAVKRDQFEAGGLRGPDGVALPPVKGPCLSVYVKEEQGWYAAAIQCMVPLPEPDSQQEQAGGA